jgi:hypothetical protein
VEFNPTGISKPLIDNVNESLYYNIRGQQIKTCRNGVNIIKKIDGAVKKVFIK